MQCRGRPIADRIIDALVAFSRLYEKEDPKTFRTVLRCQQQLTVHINALYASYDALLHDPRPSDPQLPRVGRMHSSLNSNIEHLLRIGSSDHLGEDSDVRETLTRCQEELVVTLQRLLLTTVPPNDEYTAALANTGRLALGASTSSQKERLLQGILYAVYVDVAGSNRSKDEGEHEFLLRRGQVAGLVLASALRLYLWLCPAVTADQAWVALKAAMPAVASDKAPNDPNRSVAVPEVWNSAMEIARDGDPLQYDCMGPCMILLGAGTRVHFGVRGEIDAGRLVDWFAKFMAKGPSSGPHDQGSGEAREYLGLVDKTCAGVLFLEAWGATVNANDAASAAWQPSVWTTSDAIGAFAAWLQVYGGQETIEVRAGGVLLMQIPIRRDLVSRFIGHAVLADRQAVEQLKLQEIFDGIARVDHQAYQADGQWSPGSAEVQELAKVGGGGPDTIHYPTF